MHRFALRSKELLRRLHLISLQNLLLELVLHENRMGDPQIRAKSGQVLRRLVAGRASDRSCVDDGHLTDDRWRTHEAFMRCYTPDEVSRPADPMLLRERSALARRDRDTHIERRLLVRIMRLQMVVYVILVRLLAHWALET